MDTLAPLGAILALAFLCESLTEYLFKDLLQGLRLDSKYLRYIAALVGVGLSLAYGLDVFEDLLGISALLGPVGEILTGLILGRGSNYVHDFYKTYLMKSKAS